ncbi:hypothetical protein ACTXT7_014461 [Hymenolepis weldensis]
MEALHVVSQADTTQLRILNKSEDRQIEFTRESMAFSSIDFKWFLREIFKSLYKASRASLRAIPIIKLSDPRELSIASDSEKLFAKFADVTNSLELELALTPTDIREVNNIREIKMLTFDGYGKFYILRIISTKNAMEILLCILNHRIKRVLLEHDIPLLSNADMVAIYGDYFDIHIAFLRFEWLVFIVDLLSKELKKF